jgi:hypothetical protein
MVFGSELGGGSPRKVAELEYSVPASSILYILDRVRIEIILRHMTIC